VGFNPTRVRLKLHRDDLDELGDFGFNPTRVRLKRGIYRLPPEDFRASTPQGYV